MTIQALIKHAPVTLSLIASFVLFAIWQMAHGVSLDNPTNQDLIRYGANFLPLTLGTQAWRLVTSGFLHIGLIHLLFNSFAMYYFGQVTEMIVGRGRFLAVFLLSVLGGGMLNLVMAWRGVLADEFPHIAAGASGGIMGLGMVLLVISMSKLPVATSLNRRSLASVMAVNIMMGFAVDGIDNAAHIGGAMTGAVLAAAFAFSPTPNQKRYFAIACVILSLIFISVWAWLHHEFLAMMQSVKQG